MPPCILAPTLVVDPVNRTASLSTTENGSVISSPEQRDAFGAFVACAALASESGSPWDTSRPERIELVIEKVGFSLGVGFMKSSGVCTDFSSLKCYPHSQQSGCALFESGQIIHKNKAMKSHAARSEADYTTFIPGDRLVIEQLPFCEPKCLRVREGVWTLLGTYPTSVLEGRGHLVPYIFLRGLPWSRTVIRLVRHGLPLWTPSLRRIFSPQHQASTDALISSWHRVSGTNGDIATMHILPFCSWSWFQVETSESLIADGDDGGSLRSCRQNTGESRIQRFISGAEYLSEEESDYGTYVYDTGA